VEEKMKKLTALTLALALPLMGADAAWDRLQTVRPGEKIWVRYIQGEKSLKSQGTMVAWDNDSLTLRLRKGDEVVARNDVRKVSVYGGKSRSKGAAYGTLIGAGVGVGLFGAVVAANAFHSDLRPGLVLASAALVFGGIGAVVGLGVGVTKKVVLYEATAPVSSRDSASPSRQVQVSSGVEELLEWRRTPQN
jgi:hypothetical protein